MKANLTPIRSLALSLAVAPFTSTARDLPELLCSMVGDQVVLDLQQAGNNHYRVEKSTNLVTWTTIDQMFTRPDNTTCDPIPADQNSYYRVTQDNSVSNVLDLPETPYNYANPALPPHFTDANAQNLDNSPAGNPVTDSGAMLGRVLFYDTQLSSNLTISCASCHQQEHGFSDPDAFSTGFAGGLTGRNSMGLSNSRFYGRAAFFWDERSATLEDQSLEPIQNDVEMGMTLEATRDRLDSLDYYEVLFTEVYGDSDITSERIALALSQFVRSIVSYQSKFDVGLGVNFSNFTAQERMGQGLFNGRGRCDDCHSGPLQVGNDIFNNGLEFPLVDLGVGGVTGNANDNGKFKTASLRNVELTAPYMHDGRFATLEEVIDHYSTGVVDHPTLSNQLRAAPPRPPRPGAPPPPAGGALRPNFTAAEKAALVAFLKTLTDPTLATDPKFSNPFRYQNE